MRASLIVALAGALVAASGPAGAVEVSARFRALAACGVAKAGPARDRACQPFNSVERGAWRDWDASPRGPAPRSWELPKDYEIDPYR